MPGGSALLVVVRSVLIDMPDHESGIGKRFIAPDAATGFDVIAFPVVVFIAEYERCVGTGRQLCEHGSCRDIGNIGYRIPSGIIAQIAAGRNGVGGTRGTHEAVDPNAGRFSSVIVQVGPTEEHVTVFMTEGADFQ